MFLYFLPIAVIVISQVIYDVSSKGINEELNAYAGTTIVYTILAAAYFLIFLIFTPDASLGGQLSHVNWALITFALGSIGLESGYIFLYRAGWNISLGGMVCNILLAMCMLGVGRFLFHETFSLRQGLGVLCCMAGLIIVFRADSSQKSLEEPG